MSLLQVVELLARGDTLGVFQLDGGGMRSLLKLMRPDNFEDISAVGALYRPGPMGADSHTNYALRKNGMQEIVPIHPELAEVLDPGDIVIDGGYGGTEASTVINCTTDDFEIIRQGKGELIY